MIVTEPPTGAASARFRASRDLPQTIRGFNAMRTDQCCEWIRRTLGSVRGVEVIARRFKKFNMTGKVLAEIANEKQARLRRYRLNAYGVPKALQSSLVKSVRDAMPDWQEAAAKEGKSAAMITCPDGVRVRNSAVA